MTGKNPSPKPNSCGSLSVIRTETVSLYTTL